MKFTVAIETLQLVEVNAISEEQALSIVKNQLDTQNPRNCAKLQIVKEVNYSEKK